LQWLCQRVLGHIGHHHRHTIALGQAQGLQVGRQGLALFIGAAVADVLAHEAVRRAVGVAGKTLFHQTHQGAVLAWINVSWNALRIAAEPNAIGCHCMVFHADQSTVQLTEN